MKNLTISKIAASLFLLLGILVACVQDNQYDTPQITCNEPAVKVNATIAEVKALYAGSVVQITSDMIIEGYVVSNDEAGNFYGSLHFQDALENPTIGFQLDTNLPDLYTKYPVGSKIIINLNGLYLGDYNGLLKVGGLFDSHGTLRVGRLSAAKSAKAIYLACDEKGKVIPKAMAISAIDDSMINTLIKLENVEIAPASLCQAYAIEGQSKPTSIFLKDCNGGEIILSNSGFSDFQSVIVPNGNGTLTAVLSKYKGTYQLKIRDTKDVVMNDARCDGSTFSCDAPKVNATIKDVKDVYSGDLVQVSEDLIFDATVTANDISGNAYKFIYVQDETGGLKIKINQKTLYLRGYAVGQQVTVKAKDLYLGDYGGEIQLGGLYEGKIGNMDESDIYKHLFIGEKNEILTPATVTIPELTAAHVGLFVKIENLQFTEEGVTFAEPKKTTNRSLVDCSANGLIVRTSGYANFASTKLPTGNGTVYGIVNVFNGSYQLFLRDSKDFSGMNAEKCDIFASAVPIDVSAIRAMFSGSKITIEKNIKITAVITSNGAVGNIYNSNAFAQDATGAIALRFKGAHKLALGTKVEIALKGIELGTYKGSLQLNNIPVVNIRSTVAGTLPSPTVITLEEALSGNFQAMLVTIKGVEFKNNTKNYKGDNVLTDCTNQLLVKVRSDATFNDVVVNAMKGAITGIMTEFNTPQLYIRDAADVSFADAYVACGTTGGGGSDGAASGLYISEYSEGSSSNKYIEIYNGTGAEVNLSEYKILASNNGKGWLADRELVLSGMLADGAFYILAADTANQEILDKSNLKLGYPSPVHFNGDDAIALTKMNGAGIFEIIDVIGTPDTDPGKGWEVAGVANGTVNHTIIRKATVTKGSTDWATTAATEWVVKAEDDWTNLGVR